MLNTDKHLEKNEAEKGLGGKITLLFQRQKQDLSNKLKELWFGTTG